TTHRIIERDRVYIRFFFSSRRRHTRSLRDWSSDVCSSDLSTPAAIPAWQQPEAGMYSQASSRVYLPRVILQRKQACWAFTSKDRSEERRVGKECRTRGAADKIQ